MLIDSPIEVDSSCCGRLVGLLTRASSNRSCLPGVEYNQSHDSPLQWLQLLRPSALTVAWAVPDSHRLPIGTRRSDLYRRGSSRVKPVVLVPLYSFSRSDAPASFEEIRLAKNSRVEGRGSRGPDLRSAGPAVLASTIREDVVVAGSFPSLPWTKATARVSALRTHLTLGIGNRMRPVDSACAPFISPLYRARMNATRSAFSCGARPSSITRLKNSTVSSSVSNRPSCM